MTNYKITNITNTTGKRSIRFNSTLNIEYVDKMQRKTIQVKPGETVFLQIHTLPLSVHKLRINKQINVIEITDNELKNSMKNKPVYLPPVIETPEQEIKIDTTEKKKVVAKKPEVKSEVKAESKPVIKTEPKTVEN